VMNAIITRSNGLIDGFNVRNAAYLGDETSRARGQDADNQSTFVLVPTSSILGNTTGATPGRVELLGINEILLKKLVPLGWNGLNKGELCPQQCD
jgi:hypothetical protein